MPSPNLTPEIQEKMAVALAVGLSFHRAAALVGLVPRTAARWRQLGGEGDPDYEPFYLAMEQAIARARFADLKVIKDAARKNWRAAAWRTQNLHLLDAVGTERAAPKAAKTTALPAKPIRLYEVK